MNAKPKSIDEVQSLVRQAVRILPGGGGTKPALSAPSEGTELLDMSGLAGILEYVPEEFTFTALAGTRLTDINLLLSEHKQYLPFDPILAERGATLGGTVAAGASGSGRYHYGGIRDFLLGVRYVNSQGDVVRGGGKVVKNAAGFDLPKLMVGSLGALGVLVELTFKVFPRPEMFATLCRDCASLDEALEVLYRMFSARLDIDSLDLEPNQDHYTIWVRLGGWEEALPARLERIKSVLGACQVLNNHEEAQPWRQARELGWVPDGWSLIKVPVTPGRIQSLEAGLANKPVLRRYFAGGQAAWLSLAEPPMALKGLLVTHGLSGLVLFGTSGSPRLGEFPERSFYQRVKTALDPLQRFVEV